MKTFAAVAAALLVLAVIVIGNDKSTDHIPDVATDSTPSTSSSQATSSKITDPSPPPPTSPAKVDVHSAALAKLRHLAIKGRAPKTGYERTQFGDAWTDDVAVAGGHNGCDTRNDVLRRDLVDIVIKPGSNDCAVLSGTLQDPYSGITVSFVRGSETSSDVQIDHVVAMSDAWQKGAQGWDESTRRNFANDPMNLQATVGSVNQQKGDGDAATWLPPNAPYRCTYVTRIVDVKVAYGLWATQAEHDAIFRILNKCDTPDPSQPSDIVPENELPDPAPHHPHLGAGADADAPNVTSNRPVACVLPKLPGRQGRWRCSNLCRTTRLSRRPRRRQRWRGL